MVKPYNLQNIQTDKLLFEEWTVESGQWKVNVSTAWILFKIIDEVDTSTVNCQLLTVNCEAFKFQFIVPLYY